LLNFVKFYGKNFKNRFTFGKDIDETLSVFVRHSVKSVGVTQPFKHLSSNKCHRLSTVSCQSSSTNQQ